MNARRLLPLAVLALLPACNDTPAARDGAISPTEPEPVADRQSSSCRAYAAELAAVRAELARTPNDAALLEREAAFLVIITDACN